MHHEEIRDLELLKADIASRLRPACAHFSERDFAEIVHQIASIELKYALNALSSAVEGPLDDGSLLLLPVADVLSQALHEHAHIRRRRVATGSQQLGDALRVASVRKP